MQQTPFQRVAILAREGPAAIAQAASELVAHLERLGCQAAMANGPDADATLDSAELLIAMGGDGAMLRAAKTAVERSKPLLGVNLGRLGFLADLGKQRFEAELASLLGGQYTSEKRMLLSARLTRRQGKALRTMALNDVVAHRSGGARILELSTTVDGRHIATHRGDGFVAATPTGSTAYAMSCGGPIVDPRLDATVMVPICPHKLDDRPLVISGAAKITLSIPAEAGVTAAVTCDGIDLGVLEFGQTLHISRSTSRLTLIHPSDYNYFAMLREKLNWGKGPATQGSG
ncbi:NAD(+)/NADH kinase [Candidatus Foliamicus sp.]